MLFIPIDSEKILVADSSRNITNKPTEVQKRQRNFSNIKNSEERVNLRYRSNQDLMELDDSALLTQQYQSIKAYADVRKNSKDAYKLINYMRKVQERRVSPPPQVELQESYGTSRSLRKQAQKQRVLTTMTPCIKERLKKNLETFCSDQSATFVQNKIKKVGPLTPITKILLPNHTQKAYNGQNRRRSNLLQPSSSASMNMLEKQGTYFDGGINPYSRDVNDETLLYLQHSAKPLFDGSRHVTSVPPSARSRISHSKSIGQSLPITIQQEKISITPAIQTTPAISSTPAITSMPVVAQTNRDKFVKKRVRSSITIAEKKPSIDMFTHRSRNSVDLMKQELPSSIAKKSFNQQQPMQHQSCEKDHMVDTKAKEKIDDEKTKMELRRALRIKMRLLAHQKNQCTALMAGSSRHITHRSKNPHESCNAIFQQSKGRHNSIDNEERHRSASIPKDQFFKKRNRSKKCYCSKVHCKQINGNSKANLGISQQEDPFTVKLCVKCCRSVKFKGHMSSPKHLKHHLKHSRRKKSTNSHGKRNLSKNQMMAQSTQTQVFDELPPHQLQQIVTPDMEQTNITLGMGNTTALLVGEDQNLINVTADDGFLQPNVCNQNAKKDPSLSRAAFAEQNAGWTKHECGIKRPNTSLGNQRKSGRKLKTFNMVNVPAAQDGVAMNGRKFVIYSRDEYQKFVKKRHQLEIQKNDGARSQSTLVLSEINFTAGGAHHDGGRSERNSRYIN